MIGNNLPLAKVYSKKGCPDLSPSLVDEQDETLKQLLSLPEGMNRWFDVCYAFWSRRGAGKGPGPWEWRVMEGCLLSDASHFLLARAAATEDSRLFRVSLASPSDSAVWPLAAGARGGGGSAVYM